MDYQKFNGIWHGVFRYDYMYSKEFRRLKELFTVDLLFDGADFKGTCKDRYTEAKFSSPATVEGSFSDGYIRFIKRYPAMLLLNEYGHPVVDINEPSFDICYKGAYSKGLFSKAIKFKGDWEITSIYVGPEGDYEELLGSGTWTMKR